VDYGAFRSSHADAGQGIAMSRWTPIYHRLRIDGKERKTFPRFAGDEETMRVAMETTYKRGRVVKGIIGSAFEFNKEIDRLAWARKTFGNVSEDMESAYAAGAAEGFKTRFLAIRIISDSEFHSPKLEEIAGEYCAAFVVEVIRKMKG
jgi:adenosylhomocysteine nucleosidase